MEVIAQVPSSNFSGELVSAGALPLVRAGLRVEARGAMARVVCEQRFENRHEEPLDVTYSLPLPADAAVSGFTFRIGERTVVGEVDRRESARDRFEQALAEGRTGALLDQERSSLFSQRIGNIPPGAELVAEVTMDQPLVWVDGEWEWRFPTTVMPRYLGVPGRVADEAAVRQAIGRELPVRLELTLSLFDALTGPVRSPSHALRVGERGAAVEVKFAEREGVRLDRDVVLRWAVPGPKVGVRVDVARAKAGSALGDRAFGLVTVVPPSIQVPWFARDLVVLIDTSGSMQGEPLDQARRVVLALLDSLSERDSLELLEFSSRCRRWRKKPVAATAQALADARAWIGRLRASGGTEMSDAIVEALAPCRREAQRQVVLVTDGAIGFETEVIGQILRRLPRGSRLHTVGVGSSVNRSLTAPAARAGRGSEMVIGSGEDPEPVARRLVRRTAAPLLVDAELSGSAVRGHVPSRLPDLFAAAPLRIATELDPAGGELVVRGALPGGERWEHRVPVPPAASDSGPALVVTHFGREAVEDLELELAAGGDAAPIEGKIERIGLDFAIATRRTSWVAVSEEPSVDPREPTRRVRIPHELPYGVSIDGLGLRAAGSSSAFAAAARPALMQVSGSLAAPMALSPAGAFESVGDLFVAHEALPATEVEGRVLLAKGTRLVIAVAVDREGFEWSPGESACVECSDGTTREAKVVLAHTTFPGPVGIGRTVRLVLELDAELAGAAPRSVRTAGAEPLTIRICR